MTLYFIYFFISNSGNTLDVMSAFEPIERWRYGCRSIRASVEFFRNGKLIKDNSTCLWGFLSA
jgi:hypothetical protein